MKPADPKPGHRVYQMRTMPESLHRRLRLLAAEQDTTLEAQVIRALKIGVESLERAQKEGK